ncbi:MAG: hypothetical protein OEV49_06745 [candidate division Zixibacteria bacterium]|nr:hypothetical protein [candidate division Zixibacteria bacterium]MDH3937574.1 hypothetical protein [candidate division Zixibacteria bacterium]MDH4032259.1 hypothetical protein [candidate division Zixibacteria bacterium]
MCRLFDKTNYSGSQPVHPVSPLLLVALMIGLITGCGGAKVVHLVEDPSFDYSQASSAEIGMAGFVSIVGDDKQRATIRRQLPPLLAQSISEKRPDLTIISPERIQQALGEENHKAVLDQYVRGGDLDQGSMIQLFSATRGLVRYVILGRVEKDHVLRFEEHEVDSTSSGTRYKVRREMAVFLQVYDLEAGRSVYGGLITNDQTNQRFEPDVTSGDADSFGEAGTNLFVSCMMNLVCSMFQKESEEGGYPAPPTNEEITRDIFEKFAESLPAPEGS